MNYKHLSKSKLESFYTLYIVRLRYNPQQTRLEFFFSFRFTLSTLHHIHLTTEQIKNNKVLSQKEFSIISQQNLFKIFWKICTLHNVTCTRTEESKINKKNSDSYIHTIIYKYTLHQPAYQHQTYIIQLFYVLRFCVVKNAKNF